MRTLTIWVISSTDALAELQNGQGVLVSFDEIQAAFTLCAKVA